MKVLIIDDSPEKIERIKKSLTNLVPAAKFVYAFNGYDARQELNENNGEYDFNDTFDLIVCDMQFPMKHNDRIDREAGIQMISILTRMKLKAIIVVASSSDTVGELLIERGYPEIPSIKASSMYNLDSQFKPYLKEWIVEVPDVQDMSLESYMSKRKRKTSEPKAKTESDLANIRKAELKREIKSLKKSGSDNDRLKELQAEYKIL